MPQTKSRNSSDEIKFVNPSSQEDWNDILCRTPGSSFFFTANWAEVLQKAYSYEPFYFVIGKQAGCEALLPIMEVDSPLTGKRGISLPFTDYCDPIARDAAQFRELFKSAVALGKKRGWRYLEGRGGEAFFGRLDPSEWHYVHKLDLEQAGLEQFSDSTRRNIRKAEKQNLDLSLSTSAKDLKEFCRLNVLTRKRHGLPPQPRRFFDCIFEYVLSRNMGFVALASLNGRAIAANVYFTFADSILFKYGASDQAFHSLRANNLVLWETIRWGRDHGYNTLCLGRTEPAHASLRRFKRGWGGQEHRIAYYRYDLRNEAFLKTLSLVRPLHKKIFSILPVPLLNLFGRILYRHMG